MLHFLFCIYLTSFLITLCERWKVGKTWIFPLFILIPLPIIFRTPKRPTANWLPFFFIDGVIVEYDGPLPLFLPISSSNYQYRECDHQSVRMHCKLTPSNWYIYHGNRHLKKKINSLFGEREYCGWPSHSGWNIILGLEQLLYLGFQIGLLRQPTWLSHFLFISI